MIQIDQRGAGKSLPYASLEENTTPYDTTATILHGIRHSFNTMVCDNSLLIEDTEKVRKHLGIDRYDSLDDRNNISY